MTRAEVTSNRSLKFSQWIRKHLKDSSTGFCVGNLDFIFWNYRQRRLILIEEKTRKAEVAPWFKRLMKEVFEPALYAYCRMKWIEFKGFHVVTFENTSPEDGKTWLDEMEFDAEGLKTYLNSDT